MRWIAVQFPNKEIHVFPVQEVSEHILDAQLCNCMPEVKDTETGKVVAHQKIGEYPALHAHWVGE